MFGKLFKKKPPVVIREHTPVHETVADAAMYGDHFFIGQSVVHVEQDYATVVAKIGYGWNTRYRIRLAEDGTEKVVQPNNLRKA